MANYGAQNMFPMAYPTYGVSYGGVPQPMPQQQMQQAPQSEDTIKWVDGEAAARAYQMRPGTFGPIDLWDTNDTIIYVKSMNQMGMPNPLLKIRYTVEGGQEALLPRGRSGQMVSEQPQVTQEDLNSIRMDIQALKEMLTGRKNQNGMNNQQNKGGNGNG